MSISTRLSTIAPDLVNFGSDLSEDKRKIIAGLVAGWACRETRVADFLGEARLDELLRISYAPTEQDRVRLTNDIGAMDKRYFDIIDKYDGLDEASEALRWFHKARAASSVLYSFDSGDIKDFCEALYEAQAATNNLSHLKELCHM